MKVGYLTHEAGIGWGVIVYDGVLSGTCGQTRQIEAVKITLEELGALDLGLEYQAHVATVGWQAAVIDGEIAGTVGLSLALEALKIQLTGTDAPDYSICYRVHVQNQGWGPWCRDFEQAGTTGLSLQAEAIQIRIIPSINSLVRTFTDVPTMSVVYKTHIQNIAWMSETRNGIKNGTTGQSLEMEAIQI